MKLKSVPSVSTQKLCSRDGQEQYSTLAAELGSVKVTQVTVVLNAWRDHGEQLRTGTVWKGRSLEQSLGEGVGEGTVQLQETSAL